MGIVALAVTFEDHPFWDFSLAVYGAQGISTACIALQERHGLDVNVLLFCTWIGASGRGRLGRDELERAIAAVAAWNREVVSGLRAVRRWMREAQTGVAPAIADALRRQIIDLEVQCEHAEQLALAAAVPRASRDAPVAARAADAVENCALYLERLAVASGPADRDDLTAVLAAALPDVPASGIRRMIDRRLAGGGSS